MHKFKIQIEIQQNIYKHNNRREEYIKVVEKFHHSKLGDFSYIKDIFFFGWQFE